MAPKLYSTRLKEEELKGEKMQKFYTIILAPKIVLYQSLKDEQLVGEKKRRLKFAKTLHYQWLKKELKGDKKGRGKEAKALHYNFGARNCMKPN